MVRIKGIMPECSGTIISYAHILTSAQCVYNKTRNNLLIIHDRDPMHVQHRHVETIIVHPLYNKNLQGIHTYSTPYKDIAVLKMSTSLLSSEYLTVLELPKVDLKPPYILCGIAGWGATQPHNPYSRNGLYWCFLDVLSPDECAELGRKNRLDEFCAMDRSEGSLPLEGDEGSPLVCDGHLLGIYTHPFIDEVLDVHYINRPAIFIKITSYIPFINSAMHLE
uniref:KLK1 protein n=1 Tax=Fopius arisanus TaxID=64838 RepID=A0A0C9R1B5_9HYME